MTFPDPDTVAYFVLLLVHFSFLLAPLDAVTLAFRLSVFPALTVFFPVILIFLTVPFMILILNVAFFPLPSVAYAVIVTVFPAAFLLNFTTPFLSTVAYFLLLVVHLIFLLLASFEILAVNFTFFPAESLLDGAVTVILATFCGAAVVGCVGVGSSVVGFVGFVGFGSSVVDVSGLDGFPDFAIIFTGISTLLFSFVIIIFVVSPTFPLQPIHLQNTLHLLNILLPFSQLFHLQLLLYQSMLLFQMDKLDLLFLILPLK